eukprot:311168-Pelagomonas_calceolata.AAC.2
MTACLALRMGSFLTCLTYYLASGISLAKPLIQVGFWLFKWTLAAVFQTAMIKGLRYAEGEQFPGWARIGGCRK